ncbi:MAG: hypothetical protein VX218_06350, partial [Pseudomonadota bacterium]|nr:hypothetical protein [Pseudomonadota bacterium]
MKVVPPVQIDDSRLVSSNVTETDYPEWNSATNYAGGARVIRAAVHRIYESVASGNVNHDPQEEASSWWIEVGATNRWAMFDEAVGSETRRNAGIIVTLAPGQAVDTIGALDTDAASMRVQINVGGSSIYDQTQMRDDDRTTMIFADLPGSAAAEIIVTLAASGPSVSVGIGTLIAGTSRPLGITEIGPSVGINDFSRRETDDFGVTTVVERGWAKRMAIRSQVATQDVDPIQRDLARLRAKACLWIGEDGYDSLTIYGFFKELSIDLALATVSYCTLTIEGLTNAPPLPESPLRDAID